MDALAERLDSKLREWKPETADLVRRRVAEIIEVTDQDALDVLRSRARRTGNAGPHRWPPKPVKCGWLTSGWRQRCGRSSSCRADPDPPRALVLYVPLTTQDRQSQYEVRLPRLRFLDQDSVANVQGLGSLPTMRLGANSAGFRKQPWRRSNARSSSRTGLWSKAKSKGRGSESAKQQPTLLFTKRRRSAKLLIYPAPLLTPALRNEILPSTSRPTSAPSETSVPSDPCRLDWAALACSSAAGSDPLSTQAVGPADGGMIVPTGQLVRPAGETHAFFGRPTDIALSPSGTSGLRQADRRIDDRRCENLEGRAGPALSSQGTRLDARSGREQGWQAGLRDGIDEVSSGSPLQCPRRLELAAAHRAGKGQRFTLTGIALSRDERTAFVCASITNCLTVVDLESGKIQATVPTGVCPFGVVLSPDGRTAYVSNFGGRPSSQRRTCRVLGRHAGGGRRSLDLDQRHDHADRSPRP